MLKDAEGVGDEELFFPQHITFCSPPASIAQKKPCSPKAAEMGPMDPNPEVGMHKRRRRRRRGTSGERALRIGMVQWGLDHRRHGQIR